MTSGNFSRGPHHRVPHMEAQAMRFKAKPLRSVLYVPGNKEDWMRKAPRYGADALILDLDIQHRPGRVW